MADRDFSIPMESTNFLVLAQALRDQQTTLQRVCAELQQERDASSTASNEAMSMILRLQSQKAKLTMETSQYQREVQETLNFANDSIAAFEDLLAQRDAEMDLLEAQIQAYTAKLVNIGCTDHQKNECFVENDVVSIPSELFPDRISVERPKSGAPIPKLFRKKREDLSVYWEMIKELDEQVRKISEKVGKSTTTSPRNKVRSCSVPPPNFDDLFSLSASGHQVVA